MHRHSLRMRFLLIMVCGLVAAAFLIAQTPAPQTPPAQAQTAAGPEPQIHDPVMAKQGDTYYAFGTGNGITVASSKDMKTWTREPPVFKTAPAWIAALIPNSRNSEWAPDIFFRNGTYYLYYAVSSFGRNNSAIGVATNTTLDSKDPQIQLGRPRHGGKFGARPRHVERH